MKYKWLQSAAAASAAMAVLAGCQSPTARRHSDHTDLYNATYEYKRPDPRPTIEPDLPDGGNPRPGPGPAVDPGLHSPDPRLLLLPAAPMPAAERVDANPDPPTPAPAPAAPTGNGTPLKGNGTPLKGAGSPVKEAGTPLQGDGKPR